MIEVKADPGNSDKLILTATVTLFLDKVLLASLSDELAVIIKNQAHKDLKKNKIVQQAVSEAASKKLLSMLGVGNGSENNSGVADVPSAK